MSEGICGIPLGDAAPDFAPLIRTTRYLLKEFSEKSSRFI
jgi:hypothetical protein